VKSIQQRLVFGVGAAYCLLWAVGGVAVYLVVRSGYVAEFDRVLKANAQALATVTNQRAGQVETDYSEDLMPGFSPGRHADYFQLWLPDGSTRKRSRSLGDGDLPRRGGAVNSPEIWNLKLPDGRDGRAIGICFVPQLDEEESPGSPHELKDEVMLVVARHRGNLDERLQELESALLAVGGSMVVATVLMVIVAVRLGLQPLWDLGERAAVIDAATLQLRFSTDNMPTELLPIAMRLNELLSRLESSFNRERRFSADVAHELRTPIAELRTANEVALKWPEDVTMARNALEESVAIALQMESMVAGLLALARCEAGQLPVRPETVALLPFVREVWQPLASVASSKQAILDVQIPSTACWRSDASLLRSILSNLLSNAGQYCPQQGLIRVAVDATGTELSISNVTEDLGTKDLPHLFERFWRKDPARSSNMHNGLGLTIARAYAEALGLHLRAEMTQPNRITLILSGAQIERPAPATLQDAALRFAS